MTTFWLKYRGTRFPIRRGETIVGRSPYCSIVLSNRLASRQHCTLRLTPEGLTIQDLGSSNGTAVNGERIGPVRSLAVGDVIRIGTDLLEVVAGESPARSGGKLTENSRNNPFLEDDDSSTGVAANTLDLVEALAASAAQTQNPMVAAPTIRRAIDALVEATLEADEQLDPAMATRLRAVVECVAAWFPANEGGRWRSATIAVLEKRGSP